MPNYNDAGSGTGGISFSTASDTLGSKISEMEAKLQANMTNMDPSNLSELLVFQNQTSKFTIMYGMSSGMVKAIKDTIQGMLQKIN